MADGSYSSGDFVWGSWIGGTCSTSDYSSTTSGTSPNEAVWSIWADSASGYTFASCTSYPSPETEVQRQARLEQRAKELEAYRLEKIQAQCRATELLRENLDKEQLEQFNQTQWFFVISQSGKRYRIRNRWVGNIDELDLEDQVVAEYCIHPVIRVPVEDSMLIQKLMLESDEPHFMQIANRTVW